MRFSSNFIGDAQINLLLVDAGKGQFKDAAWIDHFFTVHILDHPARQGEGERENARRIIENPYLR
jgi:hypothetical protein